MNLTAYTQYHPIVPFIRESDLPARDAYYIPERKLLDYLLIYAQKGELIVTVEGKEHLLQEDNFCLIQPGAILSLRALAYNETPFAHLDIFFHPDRASSFPTRPGQIDLSAYAHLMQPSLNDFEGLNVPVLLKPHHPAHFRRLMLRMINSWLSPDPLYKLDAQAAGTELVFEMIRDHAATPSRPERTAHTLDWVDAYLSIHLAEPLSIQDMARRAHLSPSRFRDVFRNIFGMPPHQYLMHLRLKHAQELIETTTYSLSEIAANCGFTDASHFSNVFKHTIGMTPGAFRHSREVR